VAVLTRSLRAASVAVIHAFMLIARSILTTS